MLAVQLAGGCDDVSVPTAPLKLADGRTIKVRLPHKTIARCLDSEWADPVCGSFPGGTDIMPCLPGFLDELLNISFPTRAEQDSAIEVAFRVLLELAGPVAGTHTEDQVKAARREAAFVLAAGDLTAGRNLADLRPAFSIAAALKVLSSERDPEVMRLMIRLLGTLPDKTTPVDMIDSAVIAIRNAIKSGLLDEEDQRFALGMIQHLERLAPRVTTPSVSPTQPKAKTTVITERRIGPLVFGIVLAAGLSAATVLVLRRPAPRPGASLPHRS